MSYICTITCTKLKRNVRGLNDRLVLDDWVTNMEPAQQVALSMFLDHVTSLIEADSLKVVINGNKIMVFVNNRFGHTLQPAYNCNSDVLDIIVLVEEVKELAEPRIMSLDENQDLTQCNYRLCSHAYVTDDNKTVVCHKSGYAIGVTGQPMIRCCHKNGFGWNFYEQDI